MVQTLADQVALVISNARLFRQAQEGLEAERQDYGELGRRAWVDMLRDQPELGFRFTRRGVEPVGSQEDEANPQDLDLPELSLPVRYRGRAFGRRWGCPRS